MAFKVVLIYMYIYKCNMKVPVFKIYIYKMGDN